MVGKRIWSNYVSYNVYYIRIVKGHCILLMKLLVHFFKWNSSNQQKILAYRTSMQESHVLIGIVLIGKYPPINIILENRASSPELRHLLSHSMSYIRVA